MVVGGGQAPAQAAKPHTDEGRVRTREPRAGPYVVPTPGCSVSSDAVVGATLAGARMCLERQGASPYRPPTTDDDRRRFSTSAVFGRERRRSRVRMPPPLSAGYDGDSTAVDGRKARFRRAFRRSEACRAA